MRPGPILALAALAGCASAAWERADRRPGRTELVVFDDGPVPLGPLLERTQADAVLAAIDCDPGVARPPWDACVALPATATRLGTPTAPAAVPSTPAADLLAEARGDHAGDPAWWYGPEHAQLGAWAARTQGRDPDGHALAEALLAEALQPAGRRVAWVVPASLRALVEARAKASAHCLVFDARAFLGAE